MHPAVRLIAFAAVVTAAIAAFTWPAGNLAPRGVPVGVVGAPPPSLADPGAFDVHRYATPADARRAVRDRDVDAAGGGRTLYVATGAGPAVAAALTRAAPGARVVDLAPGTASDPQIATLPALALPLTLLGIVTALLTVFTARSTRERLGLVAAAAAIVGTVGALLTQTWLDALPGSWLALAGVLALAVVAVAAPIAGLAGRIGRPGIAVGAILMMLVANPWSGVGTSPSLLPEPAGTIGQLLPTGAAGQLLRSVAYFDGAGAQAALLVLGAWAAIGVALLVLPARRPAPAPAPQAEPATA